MQSTLFMTDEDLPDSAGDLGSEREVPKSLERAIKFKNSYHLSESHCHQ